MKLWIMGGIESLRFFSDNKAGGNIVRQVFVKYDSDEYHQVINEMQNQGCGAFFTVNRTNGRGATLSDIMQIRSYYVDLDGVEDKDDALLSLMDGKLRPSAIVETKRGFHAYWYAAEPLPVSKDDYDTIQRGLLKAFKHCGADSSAKDLARVLRLPGYLHLKDPSNPFKINIIHQLPARSVPYYRKVDMMSSFPADPKHEHGPVKKVDDPKSWLLYLLDLSSWDSKPGERNTIMLLSAGVAIKFGVTIHSFVDGMLPIVRSWDIGRSEKDELWRVARWAYDKGNAIPPYVVAKRGVPIRPGL
jgi:hypothetical protein